MKSLIVVLCVLYLTSFTAAQLDEGVRTCLQDARASIADIPTLIQDTSDEGSKKRGCLMACLMQNAGLMTGNVLNLQKIDEMIEQISSIVGNVDELRETVHQCVESAADDDQCVVGENFAKCGLTEMGLRLGQVEPNVTV